MTGRFIAVVGPSGAGKDTLLDAARAHLGEDGPIRFVRRVITRPAEAGGEDHEPCSVEDFHRRAETGEFVLHWGAHGLFYGIPADVDDTLAAGRSVLANLSRTALAEMRARYQNRRIVVISASPEILAVRLAARGRETEEEIRKRLARTVAEQLEGNDVITVLNDGTREEGVAAFLAALR